MCMFPVCKLQPNKFAKGKRYMLMERYGKSKHCQESWVLILTSAVNGLWFGNVTSGAGGLSVFITFQEVKLDTLQFSHYTITSLSFSGGEKGGKTVRVENQLKSKCLYHEVIIKTQPIKLLQVQDDTLYYSNTMLEQQILSVLKESRWWLKSLCTFINKLNINEILGKIFPESYNGARAVKARGIQTLLLAWPWHNRKGLAARLEEAYYYTLSFTQVSREEGLLAKLIFWWTIFPYIPEAFAFPKKQVKSLLG